MSDYSDLVKRLRRDGIAARDTLKCVEMAPTVDPEDALKAADVIEVLERDAVLVTDAMVALTDRVAELKAALKPFADASDVHLGNDDMSIAFGITIKDLRQARKVLENA